jgi:hypothetical protein
VFHLVDHRRGVLTGGRGRDDVLHRRRRRHWLDFGHGGVEAIHLPTHDVLSGRQVLSGVQRAHGERRQPLRGCFGRGTFPTCLDAVDQLLRGDGMVLILGGELVCGLLGGGQARGSLCMRVEVVVDRLGVHGGHHEPPRFLITSAAACAANVQD